MSRKYFINVVSEKVYFEQDGLILCRRPDQPDSKAELSAFNAMYPGWTPEQIFSEWVFEPIISLPSVATAEAPV